MAPGARPKRCLVSQAPGLGNWAMMEAEEGDRGVTLQSASRVTIQEALVQLVGLLWTSDGLGQAVKLFLFCEMRIYKLQTSLSGLLWL